jgi:hypothetical protein
MSHTSVTAVKALGINTVKLAHAGGKIAAWRFNQQVVVIIHQAACVAEPAKSLNTIGQNTQEQLPILMI